MGSSGFSKKLADHSKLPKGKIGSAVVLDGWGEANPNQYNCIHVAETPTMDSQEKGAHEKWRLVRAHGKAEGLPTEDDMGNSEVGHNALGAGCISAQGFAKSNPINPVVATIKDHMLTGPTNYVQWRKNLIRALEKIGHKIVLDSPCLLPPYEKDEPISVKFDRYEQWHKSNEIALLCIMTSLSEELQRNFIGYKHAWDIIIELDRMFAERIRVAFPHDNSSISTSQDSISSDARSKGPSKKRKTGNKQDYMRRFRQQMSKKYEVGQNF